MYQLLVNIVLGQSHVDPFNLDCLPLQKDKVILHLQTVNHCKLPAVKQAGERAGLCALMIGEMNDTYYNQV